MVIYNGALIIYSELYIESQAPVGDIFIGSDGIFQYQDNSYKTYGSARS